MAQLQEPMFTAPGPRLYDAIRDLEARHPDCEACANPHWLPVYEVQRFGEQMVLCQDCIDVTAPGPCQLRSFWSRIPRWSWLMLLAGPAAYVALGADPVLSIAVAWVAWCCAIATTID